MNYRRALTVTALMLVATGLSISLFASTQQAGEITKVAEAAADLYQPPVRYAASAIAPPDNILIECPLDAHVGVVDLPQEWSVLFVGNYHWKDIVIVQNSAKKRIEVSCVYKDNFSMTRFVSLAYSCARLQPGDPHGHSISCDLKPGTPRGNGKP